VDQKTFELLQKQDWADLGKRLVEYGARKAWSYKWRDGGNWELIAGITVADLAQEVIEKTIEGRRKWDPNKGELWPWLKAQLRSEMNHLYHSEAHKYEAAVPESEGADAGEGVIGDIQYDETKADGLVVMGSSIPEPEKALLAKERQEWIEQRADDVFQAVGGDQELEEMVEAILNGCEPKPRYLADELKVPRTNINNRQKRLKRHASKLMKKEDV
jgi:DNA-directed RNA polymerase specialized sigma24 family protein